MTGPSLRVEYIRRLRWWLILPLAVLLAFSWRGVRFRPAPDPTVTPTAAATAPSVAQAPSTPTLTVTAAPPPSDTPTSTHTPTPTPTSTGIPCSNPTAINVPFTRDGSGDFCWSFSATPSYINSWNLAQLSINGVDFTNKWVSGGNLPAKINGLYYVHYVGTYAWSHVEIR